MDIKQQIISWVEAHEREFYTDLAKLIEVDSAKADALPGAPYGKNCADVLAVAQRILGESGFESTNHDNYVITADLNDEDTDLGILAHLDIVPVGDGWSVPPLKLTEDEHNIYGRGTADDKGPALAAFYAMRAIKELGLVLSKNCKLILGADEECGSSDIKHYFASNPIPPNTLSPDAEYPVINIEKGGLHADASAAWEKEDVLPRIGYVDAGIKLNVVPASAKAYLVGLTADDVAPYLGSAQEKTGAAFAATNANDGVIIQCTGANAHASTPYEGNNALTALNTLLAALPLKGRGADLVRGLTHIFPHNDYYGVAAGVAQEDDLSGKLTITLDILQIDDTSAIAQADCRAPICASDENLTDVMRRKYAQIGFEMADNKMFPPHHVSEESPLVQTLLSVYESYTGDKGSCIAIGGGTYVHSLPGGVSFGASFLGTNNNMHAPDEFAVKQHLMLTIQMYAQTIWELCR